MRPTVGPVPSASSSSALSGVHARCVGVPSTSAPCSPGTGPSPSSFGHNASSGMIMSSLGQRLTSQALRNCRPGALVQCALPAAQMGTVLEPPSTSQKLHVMYSSSSLQAGLPGAPAFMGYGLLLRGTHRTGGSRSVSTSAASQSNSAPSASAPTSSSNPAANQAAAQQPAKAPVVYSPLHYNIEEFIQKVAPTEGERRIKTEIIEDLKLCVKKTFPQMKGVEVQVFGSFANGLSCWNSDLDVVVTGLLEPDKGLGGYEPADRAKVTARLRRIADSLRHAKKMDVRRVQFIPRARIPILKLWTRSRVCVDVSISDDSGPRAARYMAQQARQYAPLRPLVLVLKTFLKAQRLNEVNSGGLSSYSLTNMVIAHLQEELKSGHDIYDLGETLYTFLLRYGEEFNYEHEAVSVASGGIVPKASLGFAMESARQAALSMGSYDGAVGWQERLCVDCPLTGRDVSNGTFRIDLVRGAWVAAARKLEALARGRRISDTSINYLQALFDVPRVLRRTTASDPYEDEYYTVQPANSDDEFTILDSDSDPDAAAAALMDDAFDADLDSLNRSPTPSSQPGGPRGKGRRGR